jgi:hypothetical protein
VCSSDLQLPVGLIRFAARLMNKASLADRLVESLVIDGSKAREMFGWKPPLTMDEQLKKIALHDSRI